MAKFKTHAFIIRCLTNLHAGSGDANYGVIDKLVQRDPITSYPVIHSSGIKGALKEYFDKAIDLPDKSSFFRFVFGSEKNDVNENMKPGEFKFFNADLLVLPVRSNGKPFFRATSSLILSEFLEKLDKLGIPHSYQGDLQLIKDLGIKPYIFENEADIMLEDFKANLLTQEVLGKVKDALENLSNVLGSNIAICDDDEQMRAFAKKLPVIARNYLENGQSENLWYEEVVPRESRFYFIMAQPDNQDGNSYFKTFNSHVNGKIIQVGANASIGYGCCEFIKISND